jgi:DNA polymerase (family 10)
MPVSNAKVAEILERIGQILEIRGENPFKARAYHSAARTIESLGEDINKIVAEGELGDLPGFGEQLTAKVTELVTTGHMDYMDEIMKGIPAGLLDLLEIPDVGPKKAKLFFDKLGVKSVEELEAAARAGKLAALDSMGEKSQAKILARIAQRRKHQGRWLLSQALPLADSILAEVQGVKGVRRASLAGSLRRMRETIGDIDILVSAADGPAVIAAFTKLPGIERVLGSGDTKGSAVFEPGIEVDVRVVAEPSYAAAQHYFTGSKEHNVHMRQLAKDRGWKLNEYGLFDGDKQLPAKDEKALFKHFRMDWITPELREDTGEIEVAAKRKLPRLIEVADLKGAFHVHSSETDGSMTISELIEEVRSRGYSYFTISDHSHAVTVANGMDSERVRKQWRDIEAAAKKAKGITIFRSTEVDIKKDGSLDFDDETLRLFDCRIAAVHSSFAMPADVMTARIIKALATGYVDVLAHPSGRLLLEREPYALNVDELLAACAKYDVAVEINSQPSRLDLDWRYIKTAKSLGCRFVVGLDAHSKRDFDYVALGVAIARKGWLTKGDVLNCLSAAEVKKWLASRRQKR